MAFLLFVVFIAVVVVIVAFVVVEYWNKCQWYWHFRYVFSQLIPNLEIDMRNFEITLHFRGIPASDLDAASHLLLFLSFYLSPFSQRRVPQSVAFVLVFFFLLFGLFGFDLTFVNTSVCSISASFAFALLLLPFCCNWFVLWLVEICVCVCVCVLQLMRVISGLICCGSCYLMFVLIAHMPYKMT